MWWHFASTYVSTFFYFIPFGIYYYVYFQRSMKLFHMDKYKRISQIMAGFASLALMIYGLNKWMFGRVIFMRWITFIIIVDVIYAITWLWNKKKSEEKKEKDGTWTKIWKSGCIPFLMLAALVGFGYWNIYHIVETDYTIYTDKNLSKDYVVVGISDTHYGVTIGGERMQEICDDISELQADVIVLPGDIVDEGTTRAQMEEIVKCLGSIKSRYGTYYVFGNHDKNRYIYGGEPNYTSEELVQTLQANGIHVLIDESVTINDEFTIIGRDEPDFPEHGEQRASMKKLLEDVDEQDFLFMLDHKPKYRKESAEAGIDLEISGHTHGGQAYTTGRINKWMGKEYASYGYYHIGEFQSIVSSGLARWGYANKTGAPAEYVVITVKSSKNNKK